MRDSRKLLGFLLRLVVSTVSISVVIILLQSAMIFPGALTSIFSGGERVDLPAGVESIFIETTDREQLELWRLGADHSKYVAVIFHGNGADVENFFIYQQYLRQLGIASYGFDYRGYGRSSGWPSEEGLYLDTDAVIKYVTSREGVASDSLILVGVSIGGGPASYSAAKVKPRALVLFSPFVSLKEAAKAVPLFGLLHPFLFYTFPVLENVSALRSTCLILAHGRRDNVIPFEQGERVFNGFSGDEFSKMIIADNGSHNDILFHVLEPMKDALQECLGEELKSPE